MLILENIIVAILKAPHSHILPNVCTVREEALIKNINDSRSDKNFRIEKTVDGDTILKWESIIGHTVAFPITTTAFFFSRIKIYNEEKKSLKESMSLSYYFSHNPSCESIMGTEIEKIKNLFLSYSPGAEIYFK
ncbi:MAG: hypothetical protein ACD_80C00212G0008 [uncultured bacterium (gcode 4)]|uniref:Uncharacterized protein n=1 Tax=uncultured bacterium (gcode 4) TaxID=1234023 RepID=K1X396_9BACT|nr:MAG: hypothetical protein ACD_80C00212G0008 [uncultured bacterium (gcode 4)]